MLLTDEQVEEYEERGFLFFPRLFSADEINSLHKALPGVLDAERLEVDRENTSGELRCAFACHTYDDTFSRLYKTYLKLLNRFASYLRVIFICISSLYSPK